MENEQFDFGKLPPRTENLLEKALKKIPSEVILGDIRGDWDELSKENDDLEVIYSILKDENLNWMHLKPENKSLFYNLMLELVEASNLEKNKEYTKRIINKNLTNE
jgi:hypothetical protein